MFSNKFGRHENVECGLVKVTPAGTLSNPSTTTKTEPIPLESVSILGSMVGPAAQVELTQIYVNREERPIDIEVFYYFPVDSNGEVTHFHAELDGKTIKGVVKPQEQTGALYEKAVEQNEIAFLVECNKPDIFKVRIFLKPGAQVKIVIGYVTEVKNEKGSNAMRFFIPTTVAPRYVPVPPAETDPKALDLEKMEFAESSPAPLTLTVNVAIQGKIKSLASPSHSIQTEIDAVVPGKENWTRAVVKFSGVTADMDRDFVLLVVPQEPHVPKIYSERIENSAALMTHLNPSFNSDLELDEQKLELIFVLDRSGSMDFGRIRSARTALFLFLHSMPADCYFNVIGFGIRFELLFQESRIYDDDSMEYALGICGGLRVELNGTQILEPLKAIFAKPLIPGYLRQIFILNDGEGSNTDQVIGVCHANAHNSRVFALGIGPSCSPHLVEGIAEAGGGTAEFAAENEDMKAKVLQQLKNALQPAVTNVHLKWIGIPETLPHEALLPVEIDKEGTLLEHGEPISIVPAPTVTLKKKLAQVPEKVPPIFDGSQLVAFGLFSNRAEVPTGVEIIGNSPDGPISLQLQVTEANDVGSIGLIHKLAAIKAIRELEFKEAALQCQGNELNTTAAKENIKKEIIELALQHGLASKHTSFFAVDTSSNSAADKDWVMQSRCVPSEPVRDARGNRTMQVRGKRPWEFAGRACGRVTYQTISGMKVARLAFAARKRGMEDESDEESDDESDEESDEESDDESFKIPFDISDEESDEESDKMCVDKSDQESHEKSGQVSGGKSDVESDKESDKKSDIDSDKESVDDPHKESDEESDKKSDVDSDEESVDDPRKESDEESDKKSDDDSDKESVDEPLKESHEESDGKSDEESDKKSADEPHKESHKEPDKMSVEEPHEESDKNCDESDKKSDVESDKKSADEPHKESHEEPDKVSVDEHHEESDKKSDVESDKKSNVIKNLIKKYYEESDDELVECVSSSEEEDNGPVTKFYPMIAKQSFNGSFALTEPFCSSIGLTLEQILEGAKTGGWNENAWATAVALAFLNEKLADLKASWELIERKAKKWLQKNFAQEMESVLAGGKEFVLGISCWRKGICTN